VGRVGGYWGRRWGEVEGWKGVEVGEVFLNRFIILLAGYYEEIFSEVR